MLAGRVLVDHDWKFELRQSLPYGHLVAVVGVLRRLDLERLICTERCRARDLAVVMICQPVIASGAKLL